MAVTYQRFTEALNDFGKLARDVDKVCRETSDRLSSTGESLGTAVGSVFGEVGSFIGGFAGGIGGSLVALKLNREEYSKARATIIKGLQEWEKNGLPIVKSYLTTCIGLEESYEVERDYYIRHLKGIEKESPENIEDNAYLLAKCIASDYQRHYSIEMGKKILSYFGCCYEEVENMSTFADWHDKFLTVDKAALYRASYNKYVTYVEKKCPNSINLFNNILICYSANHPVYLGCEEETKSESYIFSQARYEADCEIRGKRSERKIPDYVYLGSSFRGIKESIMKDWNKEVVGGEKLDAQMNFIVWPVLLVPIFLIVNIFLKLWKHAPDNSAFLFNTWYGNALMFLIVLELIMSIPIIKRYISDRKHASSLIIKSVNSDVCKLNDENFTNEISTETSKLQKEIGEDLVSALNDVSLRVDELLFTKFEVLSELCETLQAIKNLKAQSEDAYAKNDVSLSDDELASLAMLD